MSGTTTVPPPARTPQTARPARPRWWRRPWVVPLGLVSLVFVAFSLPPYVSFDPAQSRVPAPDWFPLHYPVLSLHVVFGSVAILTCCLQVWPWLRRHHPKVHRVSGRMYVFAGVLPAGVSGLIVGVATPFGPVAAVSSVMVSVLWLVFTVAGYRMARQRRYADHRKWMIRSFALTMSIVLNRVWGAMCFPLLRAAGVSEEVLPQTVAGITSWFGWTTVLLFTQWWLERNGTRSRRPAARASAVGAAARS